MHVYNAVKDNGVTKGDLGVMKKLLTLLLSSALCFNNAFLTVQALDNEPAAGEETKTADSPEEVQEESAEALKDTAEAAKETEDKSEISAEAPAEEVLSEEDAESEVNTGEEEEDGGQILTESSGTCGDSCTYILSDIGVLTISGNGAMADYDDMVVSNMAPWYPQSKNITQIVVNEGITSIGEAAFYSCYVESVTIADSVTKIGDYAFEKCTKLPVIEIPDGVTSIGEGAFSGCTSLAKIIIPKSVTEIGIGAFEECTGLVQMTFPDTVTCIKEYLFDSCSNLKKITIPNTVTSIEGYAFNDCERLYAVDFIGSEAEWNKLLQEGTDETGNDVLYDIEPDYFPVAVESVKLNKTDITLTKNDTEQLTATVAPANASNKKLNWKSSNPEVAVVDSDGNVNPKSGGTAVITVTSEDGNKTATCTVTVYVPAADVKLNKTSLSLNKDEISVLTATVTPSDASNKKVTWSSNNSNVAAVDASGKVTAKAAGTATITVKTEDGGKTATCKVTVSETKPTPTPTPTPTPKPTPTASPTPTKDPAACRTFGFCPYQEKNYWYENGIRQGTVNDPKGVIGDGTNRGREIYDPDSNAWYWLDSIYDGAKATGKEVWVPYIYQNEADWKDNPEKLNEAVRDSNIYTEAPDGTTAEMGEQVRQAILNKRGKWVRYDENGKMLKGWVKIEGALAKAYPNQAGNQYYYDYKTGLMAKGWTTIGGRRFFFDETTGVLRQ